MFLYIRIVYNVCCLRGVINNDDDDDNYGWWGEGVSSDETLW